MYVLTLRLQLQMPLMETVRNAMEDLAVVTQVFLRTTIHDVHWRIVSSDGDGERWHEEVGESASSSAEMRQMLKQGLQHEDGAM